MIDNSLISNQIPKSNIMKYPANNQVAIPMIPVPADACSVDCKLYGRSPDDLYPYHNIEGKLIGYTGRWNKRDSKDIRPITFCQMPDGKQKWTTAGIPEPRPLYNLPQILQEVEKTVLICEGEKTAEAAKILFPEYVITTTMLGAQVPHKTDFSSLRDRDIIIAMDNDDAGRKYGREVCKLCKQVGAKSIQILNPELFKQYCIQDNQMIERQNVLPKSYDLADALDEGWTDDHINQYGEVGDIFVEPNVLFGGIDDSEQAVMEEWPGLQPIKAELLPVRLLPSEMIPEPFRPWLIDIAHRMQCPLDHVAIPSIIMVASVIGAGCCIRPKRKDTWKVIPNLWGGIIGNPGTLKSPALSAVLEPLERLAQKAREEFEAKKKEYSIDLDLHKLTKDAIKSEAQKSLKAKAGAKEKHLSLEEAKHKLNDLQEPTEPICKRYKTNDATIEKVTELLTQNPKGLLLVRDELIGLLDTWDKEGHEVDRAFYLEAWNGYGSYDTDRITRGSLHTPNMCISILGSTQPAKLTGYLYRTLHGNENDGLLQRLQLLVYPDPKAEWQLIDEAPNKEAKASAYKVVEALTTMDFTSYGAIHKEEDSIPYFQFSDEAQELFYEWLKELEITKIRGEEEAIISEHLAKYRKLMPALALIFHLIDIADGKETGPITLRSAMKAAAWCDYLELHARRIYNIGLNRSTQSAIALSKKLKSKELETNFTVRDVYRRRWSLLTSKEDVQDACEELCHAGWLREITTESRFSHKGKTEYVINPKIWREDD